MKSTNRNRFYSSPFSSATVITTDVYANKNITDHSTSTPKSATDIPIESSSNHLASSSATSPSAAAAAAAARIQAAYRSHVIRRLVKKIEAIRSAVDDLERQIQRQETVDAIRENPRERMMINEALMRQLLELDSVPGRFDATVRDRRRSLSRRVVELQEVVDGICRAESDGWDCGIWRNWDEILEEMEKGACRERGGGDELERFCFEKLGFRCLERFLREL